MSVEQEDIVDFINIDIASGNILLTISDHLPWEENEGEHLVTLQNKLNAYLAFIESGELIRKVPDARDRPIIINLVGKFPLSQKAEIFFGHVKAAIERAGFQLQFSLIRAN